MYLKLWDVCMIENIKCETLFKVGNSQKVGMALQFPHPPFAPGKWLETTFQETALK